jgi:predicted CopG family antitoxin
MYYTNNTKYKRCTILLKEDIYKRLKTKGKFGESFSELISRLLDEIELLEKRVRLNDYSE